MSRKSLIMGIFILLSVTFSGSVIYGAEDNNNIFKSESEVIEGINNECSIDLLYEQREQYCVNYKENERVIEAIDNRLEHLGIEEISYSEVALKLNGNNKNSSRVALNSSSTVKWTSTRQTTVYRGKTYELQIVRGVPASVNSELYATKTETVTTDTGKAAAAQNVVGIVLNKSAGYVPKIGPVLTAVQTVYDIYKGIVSGLKGTTVVSNIKSTYFNGVTASYLYVFVKYSGDPDNGNQILAYAGTQVESEIRVIISGITINNNVVRPKSTEFKYEGSIASSFYKSYVDIASSNFYNYKSGNKNIVTRYELYDYYIETVRGRIQIKVPTPYSGY